MVGESKYWRTLNCTGRILLYEGAFKLHPRMAGFAIYVTSF